MEYEKESPWPLIFCFNVDHVKKGSKSVAGRTASFLRKKLSNIC